MTEDSWFHLAEPDILPFSIVFMQGLEPSRFPSYRVLGAITTGPKQPGCDGNHMLPLAQGQLYLYFYGDVIQGIKWRAEVPESNGEVQQKGNSYMPEALTMDWTLLS